MRPLLKKILLSVKPCSISNSLLVSPSILQKVSLSSVSSSIPVTEREGFLSLLPTLVSDLSKDPDTPQLHSHLSSHLERVINYNIHGGKLNRGISVPVTYSILHPSASASRLVEAALLGWTVEFLQAFYLMADDIMDGSETRRGQPCWFRREEIGLSAFNDAIIFESWVYSILRKYFRQEPCYLSLLETMLQNSKLTSYGQALDLSSATNYTQVRGKPGSLDSFTTSRYSCIGKYKTSYYSFVLPVHLAMRLAGIQDESVYSNATSILLDIGHYFQVCDDMLDCYGDPLVTGKLGTDIQNGKCSWLITTVLGMCDTDQKHILEKHYGSLEPSDVSMVRAVYQDLKVQEVFDKYEEEVHHTLMERIDQVEGIPKEVFTFFLDRIYKRTS